MTTGQRFLLLSVTLSLFLVIFSSTLRTGLAKEEKQHVKNLLVNVDQAKLLRLPENGADIILGNPSIADISIQSSKLIVITGKSFGTTNLIVLDANKDIILEANLTVASNKKNIVSVYKGSSRQSYTCNPTCQTILAIGDDEKFFSAVSATVSKKISVANDNAKPAQEAQ